MDVLHGLGRQARLVGRLVLLGWLARWDDWQGGISGRVEWRAGWGGTVAGHVVRR